MFERLLLLAHAGFTLSMVGVMWSVQLTVYPQFREVSAPDFPGYAARHSQRIVAVLAPFAPAEVVAALLLFVVRPDGVSGAAALGAGLLLVLAWISTGLFYAPLHGRLQAGGRDEDLVERLIVTNWFRTLLWTARGVIALWFLY